MDNDPYVTKICATARLLAGYVKCRSTEGITRPFTDGILLAFTMFDVYVWYVHGRGKEARGAFNSRSIKALYIPKSYSPCSELWFAVQWL